MQSEPDSIGVQSLRPVPPGARIAAVDVLRGFAVFGILVANMASFAGFNTDVHEVGLIDRAILLATTFLVRAKFYSLFSFLFGWGFAVQMDRALERGRRFGPFWLRRMLVLLVFGLLHGVFLWSGDILALYAVLGMALLLFRKRSPRFLLAAASACLLFSILWVWPGEGMEGVRGAYQDVTAFMRSTRLPNSLYGDGNYWAITRLRWQDFLSYLSWLIFSVGNVFAMFLLGLYAGRRRLLRDLQQHLPLVRRVLFAGLLIGAGFNGLVAWAAYDSSWLPAGTWRVAPVAFRTIGAPALMSFYIAGFLLLMQRESWRQRLKPLAAVGRLALTNYLLQSAAATMIFYGYGLGLYGEVSASFGLVVTVLIFLGQIRFSQGWLKRYRMGPVEWLWRSLAYGRLQPFKRGGRAAGEADDRDMGLSGSRVVNLRLLGAVWVILALWAVGLGVWYFRMERYLAETAGPVLVQAPAAASIPASESDGTQAGSEPPSGSAGAQPAANALPGVQPVPYRPELLAGGGDPLAMAAAFDVDRALSEVETLTEPGFAGRQAGSPGGRAAGEYIARQFARYGLQPAGDDGSFFQEFEVNYTPLAAPPSLAVWGPDGRQVGEYRAFEDFAPLLREYAGSGSASGPLWWLDGCDLGDYENVDVSGAVVLCDPENVTYQQATRYAREHGAAGLLLLADAEARPPDFGLPLRRALVPEPLPAARVFPPLADDLLAGSRLTLDALEAAGESRPLSVQVSLEVRLEDNGVCPGPACPARNVLGVLPGRDPVAAQEVVVLGAHYDHMGAAPDGLTWAGANDNASGVAVLLEIARTWHEQGYVPRRTVLFAAWDAEELGLLGSYHYAAHPVFPLESTVAMLQADMVGAGTDTLAIGGEDRLSAHLAALAESFDLPHRVMSVGGSDHRPFLQAGIPAALLIWMSGDEPVPHYHRPADLPAIIEPEKLEGAGRLMSLAALDLAEGEPAVRELLSERSAAAQSGNLDAFLATSLPDQHAADRYWFEDLQRFNPEQVTLSVNGLQVTGNQASGVAEMQVRYPHGAAEEDLETLEGSLRVRFERTQQGWKWAGPDLVRAQQAGGLDEEFPGGSEERSAVDAPEESELGPLPVSYPVSVEPGLSEAGYHAARRYAEIAARLSLPEHTEAELVFFAEAGDLRAATALSLPPETASWVGADRVALVFSPGITESLQLDDGLAKLALAEAGISEAAAPWLWEGLPLVLQAEADSVAVQREMTPQLADQLAAGTPEPGPPASWAAVSELRSRLGWEGLGRFIADLGDRCRAGDCRDAGGLDAALQTAVGLDAAGFEAAWQSAWRTRLERAQADLDDVLDRRTRAARAGDTAAFLATVDDRTPGLRAEQAAWLAGLDPAAAIGLTQTARPVALLEGGAILARVEIDLELEAGSSSRSLHLAPEVMFVPEAGSQPGRLVWAGSPLVERSGAQVRLRYPMGQDELSADLLERAESIYARFAERLGLSEEDIGEQLVVSLHGDPQGFLAAVPPEFVLQNEGLEAWGDAAGIRLRQAGLADAASYEGLLAGEIARWLLLERGVPEGWLMEGLGEILTRDFGGGGVQAAAGLPQVAAALEAGALPALADWSLEDGTDPVLARAQAWDAVNYIVERYGWDRILGVIDRLAGGAGLEAAFRAEFGVGLPALEAAWRDSLANGHISPQAERLASEFDIERAMQHVEALTSPGMDGRLAGSRGSQAAAEYIADRFDAYGLRPAGDTNQSYFQTFTITYTEMIQAPRLEVLQGGDSVLGLLLRRDFLPLRLPAGETEATGELVWWPDPDEPLGDQSGNILLAPVGEDAGFLLRRAEALNAAGLLFLGSRYEEADLYGSRPFHERQIAQMPLLELTLEGSTRLLSAIDQNKPDLQALEQAQPLGVRVRLASALTEPRAVETANVLGLLPGSDPELRGETLILGSHYDHVGNDPEALLCPGEELPEGLCEWLPGLRYSGANDDASGVAALLEIARLLHESGHRPKRSLLFAAWGAQEYGQLGSNHYLDQPVVALQSTMGLVQLDGLAGGKGFNLGIQGNWQREGLLLFGLQASGALSGENVLVTDPVEISDHSAFREAGLPGVLVAWRLADERNLPDDLANRVSPARLELSGRVVTLGILSLLR